MVCLPDSMESIKVEPYWNVKYGIKEHGGKNRSIKVEPYWNVKFAGSLI